MSNAFVCAAHTVGELILECQQNLVHEQMDLPVHARADDHGVLAGSELDVVAGAVVGQVEVVGGGRPLGGHGVDPLGEGPHAALLPLQPDHILRALHDAYGPQKEHIRLFTFGASNDSNVM